MKPTETLVHAEAARRDMKRLADLQYHISVSFMPRLWENIDNQPMEKVLELVIVKEARDFLDCYDRDPGRWPQGRTAESALEAAKRLCNGRYRRGKCDLCKGPALPCTRRHAQGRSCA